MEFSRDHGEFTSCDYSAEGLDSFSATTLTYEIIVGRQRISQHTFQLTLLYASPFAFRATGSDSAHRYWQEHAILSCPGRLGNAHGFALMAKQDVPGERIIIAETFEPPEAREEVREIRRRAYHDPDGLLEVLTCTLGPPI